MTAKNLERMIQKLSIGSFNSVQTGDGFGEIDSYLDFDRSIEKDLMIKMDQIQAENGGIILVVGNAGDGKSHLFSKIKKSNLYRDFAFYNDATVSCSPQKTAIETLESALNEFSDEKINNTNKKLVIAINLGKLNNFICDELIQKKYNKIIKICNNIFTDEQNKKIEETNRIKVLLLSEYQIFEYNIKNNVEYPIDSEFCSTILYKIVAKSNDNPFYLAYLKDKPVNDNEPIILNYELLMIESIRNSIVKYIIEAIFRCQLIVSPREFLDFISNIILPYNRNDYHEKDNFFEALLPNLIFHNGSNNIQKAIHSIEPIKVCNKEHDKLLALFFTSNSINKSYFDDKQFDILPGYLVERTNKFYSNNGIDLEKISLFLFNLNHLLHYHSDCKAYVEYLSVLKGIFTEDGTVYNEMFDDVKRALPRHFGIYTQEDSIIPLPIQGCKYKLLSKVMMKGKDVCCFFNNNNKNKFQTYFYLIWQCGLGGQIPLFINYQTFLYIKRLNNGRLALNFENDRNLELSKFSRRVSEYSEKDEEIYIISPGDETISLKKSFGSIKLS